MHQAGFVVPKFGLEALGLKNLGNVYWNLQVPSLYEEAVRRREGVVAEGGALVVRTGIHTGRSPNDKFIVEDGESKGRIDWGKTNKPIAPDRYRALYNRMIGYAQRRDLFVRDCWAGADPAHRIGVRVVNETAWHNLFARNMFLRPKPEELEGFKPEFTILNLPGFQADPALDGTASDCAILVNFTDRVVAICGTWYAGEIKKSVFTILNYLLPDKNVLPMHASANVGPKNDVAIFFGLSGTGKTTLARHFAGHVDGDVQFAPSTGKAAQGLRSKGASNARTIHSLIYRPRGEEAVEDETTGKTTMSPTFAINRQSPVARAKLVVVDECSMVDEELG
ncbi:MAG: phosphoenolpyruvate carboxykinase (ATP), partial [Reyranella sp.]|nr:phosphoenolpyruvate carboxykinase (ATP) [Reyranella sp.]